MALTYGFFDATYDEESQVYDRAYNSGHFTEYFGQILGSGVCVHNNADSMLVTVAGSTVTVAPGYLFINGYWLKNDSNYTIHMSGVSPGTYAILARLDVGNRAITILYTETAESYTYSLVLGYVTVLSSGNLTVTDTRADTSICGKIDSAGGMSAKVATALAFIDNDIPRAFSDYEAQVSKWKRDAAAALSEAQSKVDADVDSRTNILSHQISDAGSEISGRITSLEATAKSMVDELNIAVQDEISSVNGTVSSKLGEIDETIMDIPIPTVGDIKYSAATLNDEWLRCDGRYVSEADYPELVATLGKIAIPSSAVTTLQTSGITGSLSNAVVHNGYIWIFSLASNGSKKLYGISIYGHPVREVSLASDSLGFSNMVDPEVVPKSRITISIVDDRIFLYQSRGNYQINAANFTFLTAEFSGTESSLQLIDVIDYATIVNGRGYSDYLIGKCSNSFFPIVVKCKDTKGDETYNICTGYTVASASSTWSSSRCYMYNHYAVILYWDSASAYPVTPSRTSVKAVGRGSYTAIDADVILPQTGLVGMGADIANHELVTICSDASANSYAQVRYTTSLKSARQGLFDTTTGSAYVPCQENTFSADRPRITCSTSHALLYFFRKKGKFCVDYCNLADFDGNTGVSGNDEYTYKPIKDIDEDIYIFRDAAFYNRTLRLWFIFLGTKLVVTDSLPDAEHYSISNTEDIFGSIHKFGSMILSNDDTEAYVVGVDKGGTVCATKIAMSNWTYSSDGAYLPNMSVLSGAIPYIRAVSA